MTSVRREAPEVTAVHVDSNLESNLARKFVSRLVLRLLRAPPQALNMGAIDARCRMHRKR